MSLRRFITRMLLGDLEDRMSSCEASARAANRFSRAAYRRSRQSDLETTKRNQMSPFEFVEWYQLKRDLKREVEDHDPEVEK